MIAVRSLLAGLALLSLSACATGAALRLEGESIQSQLDAAREAGAYRCAPRELARAESHLEFLQTELTQGNAVRAAQHRNEAQTALVGVLEKVKICPPLVGDRDGDGIDDENDLCPDHPGPPELRGCPDRDGDGLPDHQDECPDDPGPLELRGCPDRDGDGVLDKDDLCPDDPGPKKLRGCPDTDGDGILDKDDKCPKVPGPVENQGCPYGDRDGDGIPDNIDQCPDEPEDFDGFEDEDGCPDPDNDGDGIPDHLDRCPNQPENFNGFEDEDGCPDVKLELVEVNRDLGKIEIKQTVYFDTGKATIKSVSFRLLNEVASVLQTYSTMRVLVEGHTDSVGGDLSNLKLSQARADSVRAYLVAQGVEPDRLTSMGFGKEKPIDTNRTKAGRERNRRVEFTITGE